jgi:hypothetical protein
LLRSNFPEDSCFSVRVPLCANVVDKAGSKARLLLVG